MFRKKLIILFLVFSFLSAGVLGEHNEYLPTTSLDVGAQTLSLKEALNLIIKNNFKTTMLQYEVLKSDSAYQRYQTNFSPFLSFETGSQTLYLDEASLDATYSTHTYLDDTSIALGKKFKTGTTITTGYGNSYTEFIKPTAFLTGKETVHHNPAVFIKIQQDLLKNCFGLNDRLQDDILKNMAAGKREIAQYNIASLLMSGLNDYWQVARAQINVRVTYDELYAYRKIRTAVKKNVNLGMLENYNLNQFNALISASEAKLEISEYNYQKSLNKLLRTINLPDKSPEFALVEFDKKGYDHDQNKLIATALAKRADYLAAELNIDSAEKQLRILKNNSLPEAVLSWQAVGMGDDTEFAYAHNEATAFDYSSWETRLSIKKVLFNHDNKIQKRDAEYQLKQALLKRNELKAEIEDEVIDGIAAVKVTYFSLEKAEEMLTESEKYFNALVRRLQQGRISTIEVKDAVDMIVQAYHYQTEAAINYNLALLNLDLITNTIFDKYDIQIDKIIEEQK